MVATGVPVAQILPGEGVVLEGGERIHAPVVISNADARRWRCAPLHASPDESRTQQHLAILRELRLGQEKHGTHGKKRRARLAERTSIIAASAELTGLRRVSLASAILSFALVVWGAVVRVNGAGMTCPDWPLCHGRPYPPPNAHAIIEYSHRTVGTITGVLTNARRVLFGLSSLLENLATGLL